MKIALVTAPLFDANSARGVGFYTKHLCAALQKEFAGTGDTLNEVKSTNEIRALKPDLVHFPFFDPFRSSLPLLADYKYVVTVHDLIPLEYPDIYQSGLRAKYQLLRQRLALSGARAVITDSYASVSSLRKIFNTSHEKIKLVYLAAAPHFKPLPKNSPLIKSVIRKYQLPEKFILFVGDVNWNKNLPTLVKAASSIDVPLVLVGKQLASLPDMNLDHPELKHLYEIKEAVSSRMSNVKALGYVSDEELVAIYNLASVYCQPSFAEGFGLPILEAFACETPVVSSRSSCLPEIAGNAAVYFDPYSVDDLVVQLKKVLSSKPLRSSMIKAGINQAKRFSWERTARQTAQVYCDAQIPKAVRPWD